MNNNSSTPFALLALNTGLTNIYEERLIMETTGQRPTQVAGVWQGKEEISWIIPLLEDNTILAVVGLAKARDQEAIATVDNQRNFWLHHLQGTRDGERELAGVWRSVPEYVAKRHDCYTLDLQTDVYWIAQ